MNDSVSDSGPLDVGSLLSEGIDAAKSGQRERARDLLMRVVDQDEENISAWLWLSGVVDELDDREVCLENVLTLDPDNEAARKGLTWVRAEKQKRQPPPTKTFSPPSESYVEPESPTTLPPPTVPLEPETRPQQLWGDPPDPHLCPYCASPTHEDDRQCPACEGELWIRTRRREERSLWMWNVMVVQLATTIFYIVMPLVVLTVVAYIVMEDYDPLPLVPVYLGLPGDVSPEIASAALEMVPRLYIVPFVMLSVWSLALLVGMYVRWEPVFYVLLGGVAVRFAAAVVAVLVGQYYGLVCGSFGIVISIASFFIVISLNDDFAWDLHRVYFALDRKAQSGVSRIIRGRSYLKERMWALAALYFRAAIAKTPGQVAGRTGLATAYMHMKRCDLAARVLESAKSAHPYEPQIDELIALVKSQRATDGSS